MRTHAERVVRLCGTPREIGVQMGARLGSRLDANIARYALERAPAVPDAHEGAWRRGALHWLRSLPERYQEEFEGLAQGAGLELERVAQWGYLEILLSGACSSAIVTLESRIWVARNNDFRAPDLWGYTAIKEVPGRIPTITFGMEGDVFTGTGVNREHLWLHYHYLPPPAAEPVTAAYLPCYLFLVEALETCRSLAEVEALLERLPRSASMLLFAVDGEACRHALYECGNTWHRPWEQGTAWRVGTNHSPAIPSERDASPLSSANRYARLTNRVESLVRSPAPRSAAEDLISILGDPGIERRDDDECTVYANVACPSTGELWYTFGGHPAASRGEWHRLCWPW